jgi:hypothetical protein
MLDYVYGLLEPEENQQVQGHVEECLDCRAALVRAEGHRKLLAAAAKAEFPTVRFDVPVLNMTATRPRRSAQPAEAASRSWGRWAVAAAVLLVVGGLSLANNTYWQQHDQIARDQARAAAIQQEIQDLEQTFSNRRKEIERELQAAQQAEAELPAKHLDKMAKLEQEIEKRQIHMSISGPPTVEAGAFNEFQVRVHNLWNQPVPAEITARVLDPKKAELATPVAIKPGPGAGNFKITLPRTLPLQSDSDFYLVVNARGANNVQGELTERLALASPVYLTHLATDKPMYQPGEVVYFRSLTLERFALKPAREDLNLVFTVTKPTGTRETILTGSARVLDQSTKKEIVGPDKEPIRGVGTGSYVIAPEASGGEYTLTVSEAKNRFPPQERKFLVNQYQKPQLNKELEFTRKSYGPGDEVVAAGKAARVEGGIPVANAPVQAEIKVDGKPVANLPLRTDATGAVLVKCQLPRQIERGNASLSLTFHAPGSVETIVRPIPIVLKKLQVEFFPEGGDLVAGVPNRVYFQARTTLDKPAELKGRIVDDNGQVVAHTETLNDDVEPGVNQGMGRFEFTPAAGRKYQLKIDSPTGIEGNYLLPQAKADGIVMAVPTGVTTDKQPLRIVLRTGVDKRRLLVGVYCRGRVMTHQRLEVIPGQPAEVALQPEFGVGGVFRVTVFEEQGVLAGEVQLVPRAERLVYRSPAQRLNLAVQPDKSLYVPGDRVQLRYAATNEKGQAVPAVLMVAVTDKSVLKLADEKTFRTMPTHFLLTTEVRRPEDLEHADFMLSNHPKAAQALDLLLGTQGWRRFAEQNPPDEFRRNNRAEADRLLVLSGRLNPATLAPRSTNFDAHALQAMVDDYNAQYAQVHERRTQAEARAAEIPVDRQAKMAAVAALRAESASVRQHEVQAIERLNEYRDLIRTRLLPAVAVGLFLACVISLMIGFLWQSREHFLPYLATAMCSFLLFGLVIGFQVASPGPMEPSVALRKSGDMDQFATGPKPSSAPREKAVDPAAPAPEDERDEKTAVEKDGLRQDMNKPGALKPEDAALPQDARKMAAPAAAPVLGKAMKNEPGAAGDQAADKAKAEMEAKRPAGPANGVPPAPRAKRLVVGADRPGMKGNERGGLEAQNRAAAAELPELAKKRILAQVPEQPGPAGPAGPQFRMGVQPMQPRILPAGGLKQVEGLRARRVGNGVMAQFMFQHNIRADGAPVPPPPPIMVREYAHHHVHGDQDVRSDFAETLYWHPVLVLPDGKGESAFDLCDSVTTFQVLVSGHTLDGRLGTVTAELESRKPLSLEPKLPIEVTASDKIDVALSVANNSAHQHSVQVLVQPANLNLLDSKGNSQITLNANGRSRQFYRFQPATVEGEAQLRFDGRADSFTDSVQRTFRVVPEGFPIVASQSDMLEGTARHELILPDTWIKGTLKYQVAVYPSTLADLQKGLEALLREPNGCFEQTSTTNYPNVLILDYLKETDQARPELRHRAQDLLGRGCQKLTSFECLNPGKNQREGYEWFGGTAPAHEALTAYGLMQFRDMARVYDVDKNMVARTQTYLMSRKDGKGGFQRNPRALDTFGRAPDHITNAYIVWALTESGKDDDVTRELAALLEQAATSADPYFLALVANSLINRDRSPEAMALLKKIAELQKPDGHLDAAQTSITGSGGRDLQIETTALAVLAWLKARRPDQFNRHVQAAVKWIGQQRGGYGGFGSTQSTILTMKALIAYARANKKTAEAGALTLFVGDEAVVRRQFPAGVEDAIVLQLEDAEKYLRAGKNNVRVEISGRSTFPYTAAWSYQSLKPVSADQCPVALKANLDRKTATEGETVGLTVRVENQSGKGQGMTVAIVGLPAGLTLPEDMKKLKDLARLRNNGTERGDIDAWEVRGRELILYWRDLAPDKKIDVQIELICRVPGEYRGPASRAYLYYNADQKCWADPLQIVITPKAE